MANSVTPDPNLRTLNNGLIMRHSWPADVDRLANFYLPIFTNLDGSTEPGLAVWIRDLLSGLHPSFNPHNFTIIEDPRTGKIVSALNLIPLRWSYGGVGIAVGQIEMVATDPAYRRRGLVRSQFQTAHEWAHQQGMELLAITGIPWYYRQFGYEMCIDMDGGRVGFAGSLPLRQPDGISSDRIRPVQENDLPFLEMLGHLSQNRSLVSADYDLARWRYEALDKTLDSSEKKEFWLIESIEKEPLGVFSHYRFLGPDYLHKTMISCPLIELKPGAAYPQILPVVLSHLWHAGQEMARQKGSTCDRVGFILGSNHPAQSAAVSWMPEVMDPYAFYIRVPDLPAFLRKVAPVLEKNLANSAWSGYNGDLKINFYRAGLRLVFRSGRLQEASDWQPDQPSDGQAAFPDLTFSQLLFGYRSLSEIEYAFPDCWADPEIRPLLAALFPKQPSEIWSMT